jgi:hypothetical protein
MNEPMIIIYDLSQAKAALNAAAQCGRQIILLSPPETSAATGPGIFAETIALARKSHGEALAGALFDCGQEAGQALAAIRRGGCGIVIDLPAETATGIKDIASQSNVTVIEKIDGPVLDLATVADTASSVTHFLESNPP